MEMKPCPLLHHRKGYGVVHICTTESLLPWLDPKSSRVYLKIAIDDSLRNGTGPCSHLFRPIDHGLPLARFYQASFSTASGTDIKEVGLLVQKDRYSFMDPDIALGNEDIDGMWMDASHAAGGAARGVVLNLSLQNNPFPLWRSLFYCMRQGHFFHPPCPACGYPLELCCDEDILSSAMLPSYRASLQRFLYCPVCHSTGGGNFYTVDHHEAEHYGIQDLDALIKDFGSLQGSIPMGSSFPCAACNERQACYQQATAGVPIVPFAFYPFRMMVVAHAGRLWAKDFLKLVSGAPSASHSAVSGKGPAADRRTEAQPNNPCFFFDDTGRKFLELLYLKCALLLQVARICMSAMKHLRHEDLILTMDQFRVDFPGFDGLLPLYWNFRVIPLAIGLGTTEPKPFLSPPDAMGYYSLSRMWFNTLLVNSRQSAADVSRALGLVREEYDAAGAEPDFAAIWSTRGFEAFSPDNIFWSPPDGSAHWMDRYAHIWQKALEVGWQLMERTFGHGQKGAVSFFEQESARLVGMVKEALFQPGPEASAAGYVQEEEGRQEEDDEIYRIVSAIRQRWKDRGLSGTSSTHRASGPEPALMQGGSSIPDLPSGAEPQEEETLILKDSTSEGPFVPGDRRSAEGVAQDGSGKPGVVEETVVLGAGPPAGTIRDEIGRDSMPASHRPLPDMAVEAQETRTGTEDDLLEETVVLTPDQLSRVMGRTTGGGPHGPEQPETAPESGQTVSASSTNQDEGIEEIDDLEETVIIGHNTPRPHHAQRGAQTPARIHGKMGPGHPASKRSDTIGHADQPDLQSDLQEDELSETVIIRPEDLDRHRRKR